MHMLCKIPSNANVWTHLACAWQSLVWQQQQQQ
jgi:hypothetical protein